MSTEAALKDLVVLDLAGRYPGGFSAMFLADHGADVLRIDPPSASGATAGTEPGIHPAYWMPDRNKRSIILDLTMEAGRDVFCRLVERADILIEGFRPGVMECLGVGYPRLKVINPCLIYCALSGFGQSGPYLSIPAHDMNYIALGGALSMIGERNGQPYLPGNMLADYGGAAMHGLIGILLALAARERTGRGQMVDVGYLDAVISLNWLASYEYFATGRVPQRGKTFTTGGQPWGQVFRCKDGEYFAIGAVEPPFWKNLCSALGREDLVPFHDPATLTDCDRVRDELAVVFLTRTRDEWWAYLKEKACCAAPVWNMDEVFRDPQVLHRDMLLEVPHPELGVVRQVGIPIKLSDTPGRVQRLGVPAGTDTDAVLGELGFDEASIAKLRTGGALG